MKKNGKGGSADNEGAFQLEDIAQRLEPRFSWQDLTLPQDELAQLKDVCIEASEIHQAGRQWGVNRKLYGKGLSVLFSGSPGNAKTMAAQVIAAELKMPVYRVDLGAVVSKYVGETEQKLKKIFDAADRSDAVLFFDEADALFGKRSQVSDAHDRYANAETAYLLQSMEEHNSVAILATNRRENLDPAFIRRMRFVVEFPSPESERRKKPWAILVCWFRGLLRKT